MSRKTAIRLRVVYRRVHCPYGRNRYSDEYMASQMKSRGGWRNDGETLDPRYRVFTESNALTCEGPQHSAEEVFGPYTLLHHCYMDSSLPEHPCYGCKAAKRWRKTLGLRTYRIAPELTTVNENGDARPYPAQIIYAPLNEDGTEWYAVDITTGNRKAVVRTVVDRFVAHQKVTLYPKTTPYGRDLEQHDTWREDCTCVVCRGNAQLFKGRVMKKQDQADISQMNVNSPGVRQRSVHDYPTAPRTDIGTPYRGAMASMFGTYDKPVAEPNELPPAASAKKQKKVERARAVKAGIKERKQARIDARRAKTVDTVDNAVTLSDGFRKKVRKGG